jgi:hypothetical protein
LASRWVSVRRIALPVFWSVLGKAGNSNTAERVALMDRFLAVFGIGRVAVQLSIEDYEELLEDIEDLTAIIERQHEPAIDFDVVIAELKADGLL